MDFNYFDIHSHLDFDVFDEDRDELLAQMKEQGIGTITVGTHFERAQKAIEIANTNEHVWACIGVHPVSSTGVYEFNESAYQELVDGCDKVVAIGECGLDFFRTEQVDMASEKKRQSKLFEVQIEFAVRNNLPVMIHARAATAEVLDVLVSKKREHGDALHAHTHFFTETTDIARQYLELDCTLSFTGVITFVPDYHELVRYVPLNMMMAETDAPFVSPAPHRGQRNDPLMVQYIAKQICELRPESDEMVRAALINNTKRVFGI